MLRVPRFGDYLGGAVVPSRPLPDAGLTSTETTMAHPWCWLSDFLEDGATDRIAEFGTDMIAGIIGIMPQRDPGDLGLDDCKSEGRRLLLGLPYADTAEPDDRLMTVEDLVGFERED